MHSLPDVTSGVQMRSALSSQLDAASNVCIFFLCIFLGLFKITLSFFVVKKLGQWLSKASLNCQWNSRSKSHTKGKRVKKKKPLDLWYNFSSSALKTFFFASLLESQFFVKCKFNSETFIYLETSRVVVGKINMISSRSSKIDWNSQWQYW